MKQGRKWYVPGVRPSRYRRANWPGNRNSSARTSDGSATVWHQPSYRNAKVALSGPTFGPARGQDRVCARPPKHPRIGLPASANRGQDCVAVALGGARPTAEPPHAFGGVAPGANVPGHGSSSHRKHVPQVRLAPLPTSARMILLSRVSSAPRNCCQPEWEGKRRRRSARALRGRRLRVGCQASSCQECPP